MHFFILIAHLYAVTFTPSGLLETKFSFEETCEFMGHKENLLIEPINSFVLDCMSSKIDLTDFCQKKVNNGKVLRGVAISNERKVLCASGETAILKVECQEGRREYCKNPKESCLLLKKRFAREHQLSHFSVTKELNCYYASVQKLN